MGYEELRVSADHMVGKFKYVIGEDRKRKSKIFHVYLQEAQLNVTPAGGGEYVHVCTIYKVNYRGHAWWVKERDIYDTEKDALKKLESMKDEVYDIMNDNAQKVCKDCYAKYAGGCAICKYSIK